MAEKSCKFNQVSVVQIVWVQIRLLPFMCVWEREWEQQRKRESQTAAVADSIQRRYLMLSVWAAEANFKPALQIESIFVFHFRLQSH